MHYQYLSKETCHISFRACMCVLELFDLCPIIQSGYIYQLIIIRWDADRQAKQTIFFFKFYLRLNCQVEDLLITQHCCLWWPESDTDVINGTSAHIVKVGEIKPLLSVWFVCSSVYGIWHACMHAYFSLYKTLKYSHKISCWFTAHIYLYPCTRTFCKIQNVTYCRWMSKYFIVSCRVMNSTPFKVRL